MFKCANNSFLMIRHFPTWNSMLFSSLRVKPVTSNHKFCFIFLSISQFNQSVIIFLLKTLNFHTLQDLNFFTFSNNFSKSRYNVIIFNWSPKSSLICFILLTEKTLWYLALNWGKIRLLCMITVELNVWVSCFFINKHSIKRSDEQMIHFI